MKALITGAARGIGRATSLRLARDAVAGGALPQFMLADMIGDEAGEVAELIREMGGQAEVCVGSVAEVSDCERAVDACAEAFGGIDLVVSNAGGGQAGPLVDIDMAEWDFAFALNTRAPLALAQRAYHHLRRSGGQVVIVASVSGTYPQPNVGAYSASKAAVIMLGRQLALEWGAEGIRTNMVLPGLIHTALTDYRYRDANDRARYAQLVPLRRIGTPDDVASAIAYLAGPDGSYCNGAEIAVDGGFLQTFANQVPVVARDQRR